MKPVLLVMASTYPRRADDPEPAFVHELSRRLTADFDVVVVCPHSPGTPVREEMDGVDVRRYRYAPERLETLVNDGGIASNLRRSPWKRLLLPGFLGSQLLSVLRLLTRRRPAAIHAHWILPQGTLAALAGSLRRSRPPLLVTCHGSDLTTLRSAVPMALKRYAARRADAFTVVSGRLGEELRALGVPGDRIAVQPMGVDLTGRFTPDPSAPRSDREILFVGRLVERKGLGLLLAAMPAVLESVPEATLTVAGFGPDEGALREAARRTGLADRVTFLGPVAQADLPLLYRRAAVFAAPFHGDEGFGLVLVEAIGCGCPAVATDVPAARSVAGSLESVTLVAPGDPRALARGLIARLLSGTGAGATLRAASEVRSRFDWASVAASYAEVLRGMIASGPGAAGRDGHDRP